MSTLVLDSTPPAPAPDISAISMYADGSGRAVDHQEGQLKILREHEEIIKLTRCFVLKHSLTLAGMYWAVGYLEATIKLSPSRYRGAKTTAKDIAALWPGCVWKRSTPKYTSREIRDWVTRLDGVELRIEGAESYEELGIPKDGEGVA
jgi:hypothetical protein